jgi:hypothetical protein
MKKLLLASVLAIASYPGYAHADNVREEWKKQCAKGDQDSCRELCHEPEDNCDIEGNPPARVTVAPITPQITKWPSPNFEADCRRDRIIVHVDEKAKGDWPKGWELPGVQIVPPRDGERRFVIINDVDKAARARLEKMLREWRKCDAYYQCLADRDAGKVKHCYANDKRWRDVYSGEL